MSNLIVVFSGKKQSGKSSGCKYLLRDFMNLKAGYKRYHMSKVGKTIYIIDTFENDRRIECDKPGKDQEMISEKYSAKIYSFADPLKDLCINLFGLDIHQCYGSDEDKNTPTHVSWVDVPESIKKDWAEKLDKNMTGFMSARHLMQIFGTDYCRQIDQHCWARALYNKIRSENHELSLVADARFPNEVTMGTEIGAKVIRLLRDPFKNKPDRHQSEIALDNFPLGEYSLVIDNRDMNIDETQVAIQKKVTPEFRKFIKQ